MDIERIARREGPGVTYMTSDQQQMAKTTDRFAAVHRSRTLHLPAILDSAFAPTLADILKECHGEDVTIDASYVQQTSALCAQVLRAAREAWKADHRAMTFVNEPSALIDLLSSAKATAMA
jgi:anti-anti-sigma regulatory factor